MRTILFIFSLAMFVIFMLCGFLAALPFLGGAGQALKEVGGIALWLSSGAVALYFFKLYNNR